MKPTPRERLDAAAGTRIPANVNLYPRIAAQLERKTFMQTLRAKPALMILFVLLALVVLSGAAYAIGRSLGYIPGVGIVQTDAPVLVLAESVRLYENGITLQITKLTADRAQTLLEYRISGRPFPPDSNPSLCSQPPALQTSNGDLFLPVDSTPYQEFSGSMRLLFPPLPLDTREVILLPPCDISPLTLYLIPSPDGLIHPATELPVTFQADSPPGLLPTATPEAAASNALPVNFPPIPTAVPNGSGLYLEKVVELESSYLLIGNFTNAGDLPGQFLSGETTIPYDFRVQDANGEALRFSFLTDLMSPSPWSGVVSWAIEIYKPIQPPITITLPAIRLSGEDSFTFAIEAGESPQPGQVWAIEQTAQMGGIDFWVEKITLESRGYQVEFHSTQPLSRQDVFCDFSSSSYDSPEIRERFYEKPESITYRQMRTFRGAPPAGRLEFEITCMVEKMFGPWLLRWSP